MGKAIDVLVKIIYNFVLFIGLCSCEVAGRSSTPAEYKYELDGATSVKYASDTSVIRSILQKMLKSNTNPFSSNTYDQDTRILMDTVIYSPDQLRMIVLVILKNPTSKLLRRENNSAYFYDGYYLYCSRDNLNEHIKIYDYSGFRLSFFYDYSTIRDTLRDYCFNRLLRLDKTEQHFNIDDKRFWSSKDFEWVVNNALITSQ